MSDVLGPGRPRHNRGGAGAGGCPPPAGDIERGTADNNLLSDAEVTTGADPASAARALDELMVLAPAE